MHFSKHTWSEWERGLQPLTDDTVLIEKRKCLVKGCHASQSRKVDLLAPPQQQG